MGNRQSENPLREIRKSAQVGQVEMADALGVSQAGISRLEASDSVSEMFVKQYYQGCEKILTERVERWEQFRQDFQDNAKNLAEYKRQ